MSALELGARAAEVEPHSRIFGSEWEEAGRAEEAALADNMLQTLVSHLASADWPANTEKQRARNATVATDLLHLLEMGQGPAPQILEAALPKIAAAKCLLAGQVRALRRRIPAKPSGDAHGQAPEVIAALAGAARTAAKQHPLFSGPAEGADATVKGGMHQLWDQWRLPGRHSCVVGKSVDECRRCDAGRGGTVVLRRGVSAPSWR